MAIRNLALSALAAAGLAACGTTYEEPRPAAPVTTAPPVVATPAKPASTPVALATLQPGAFKPGGGILDTRTAVNRSPANTPLGIMMDRGETGCVELTG